MTTESGPGPYLNRDDARCNRRLTLVHLPQAFRYCVGRYTECAVFRRIRAQHRERDHAPQLARSA